MQIYIQWSKNSIIMSILYEILGRPGIILFFFLYFWKLYLIFSACIPHLINWKAIKKNVYDGIINYCLFIFIIILMRLMQVWVTGKFWGVWTIEWTKSNIWSPLTLPHVFSIYFIYITFTLSSNRYHRLYMKSENFIWEVTLTTWEIKEQISIFLSFVMFF